MNKQPKMDKQVQDSIQKFEDKREFFEVKLQTRQSFREDQQALERRLSKYRDRGRNRNVDSVNGDMSNVNGDSTNDVEINKKANEALVNGDVYAKSEGESDNGAMNNAEINGVDNSAYVNDDGHFVNLSDSGISRLECIVMDIQKEQSSERERTTSETADKEDVDIQVTNDVINIEESENKTAKQNGIVNGIFKNDDTEKLNGRTILTNSAHVNGSIPSSRSSVPNNSTNGRLVSGHVSANKSNSLPPNGHVNSRSLTPEPRLKLRGGTRLYEKNAKLSASSMDHLDKISNRGSRSTGHNHQAGSKMRKSSEQPILVPVVPAIEVTSLPSDGNLRGFSVEEMVSVFRMLHFPEKLIFRLASSRVDGKRFGIFSDRDLETLGIRNPVVKYFRDRSSGRTRLRKKVFML